MKNNSYIKLDDWIHIRIVWSCSNAVHNVSYVHKILATGLTVAKTLIKYKNNLEKNDEVKKEPIDIKFAEQKAC